jgi:hypothetical protein
LLGDFDERILVGRMQPAATDVEGDIRCGHDGVAAPTDAAARFQHDHREAGIFQRPRSAEACGARADDGDIDFGGEGHDVVYFIVMAGLVPAIHVFVCNVLSKVKIWMPGTKATAIRSEFLVWFASHCSRD